MEFLNFALYRICLSFESQINYINYYHCYTIALESKTAGNDSCIRLYVNKIELIIVDLEKINNRLQVSSKVHLV
jgi:hypothetical protein